MGDAQAISLEIPLGDDAATARFGAALAPALGPGDCLLLSGPLGAGKSALARAIIQARLAAVDALEDVPSPTFTLVQTYTAGPLEIWHADLYRLSDLDEVAELGLDEAFVTALCLVEWPDRLGALRPPGAIDVTIAVTGETGRTLSIACPATARGADLARAIEAARDA